MSKRDLQRRIDLRPMAGYAVGGYGPAINDLWERGSGVGSIQASGMGAVASGRYSLAAGYDNTASGDYSAVVGGANNTASGYGAGVFGGYGNEASGEQYPSTFGGYYNTASGYYHATTFGGYYNTASGYSYPLTVGGDENVVNADYRGMAVGGKSNLISGDYSVAVGGYSVEITSSAYYGASLGSDYGTVSGYSAAIIGGYNPTASGKWSVVVGGDDGTASGYVSAVVGGANNTASGSYAVVVGGSSNTANSAHGVILGGSGNTTNSMAGAVIVAGVSVTAARENTLHVSRFLIDSIDTSPSGLPDGSVYANAYGHLLVAGDYDAEPSPSGDASDITFTPAVLADWDGSTDPGNVDAALDQLAARVTDLSAVTGDVETDPIWDAKGDLAVGTGANTADRLPVGTDGQWLVSDSGATLGVKWDSTAGATLTRASDQSISSTTDTPVQFTSEVRDDDGYADIGAYNTRLTIPRDGWYLIVGWVDFDSTARTRYANIRSGGSSFLASSSSTMGDARIEVILLRYLTASTYLELVVWTNTGGDVNNASFSVVRL